MQMNKLNGKIAEMGFSKATLADELGIERPTFYRRLRLNQLHLSDVVAMTDILKMSQEEVFNIFFA